MVLEAHLELNAVLMSYYLCLLLELLIYLSQFSLATLKGLFLVKAQAFRFFCLVCQFSLAFSSLGVIHQVSSFILEIVNLLS